MPATFASGSEADWLAVLAVHLDGYLNVLRAALPIMAAARHGSILGVTSGSGWRPADTGAYGCAKRAVASLSWQLGAAAPPGVVINAMSPIAVTRMVTAALARSSPARGQGSAPAATGGLSLGSMPAPDELGPLGAHLVDEAFSWCRGKVIFAAGSEVAVVDPPRLIEAVRFERARSPAHVLEAFTTDALVRAETSQLSGGGSNPRFGPIFDGPTNGELPATPAATCVVVSDRPELSASVAGALERRGLASHVIRAGDATSTFRGAADALAAAIEDLGPVDAVVVAMAARAEHHGVTVRWEDVLAEHAGIVEEVHCDASWARAVADYAARAERPVRLVTLTDATTAGGRSRAQAAAQLARAASKATSERVGAFAVAVETRDRAPELGELAAHLVGSVAALALGGAELVAGAGWFGLRSHPRPGGTVTFGGPDIPEWFDDVLRGLVGPEGGTR